MVREDIERVLKELSKVCTKPTDITICGGASMVLNYSTRESTRDIDCFRLEERIKKEAVNIARTLDLEYDWLNDNVCVTQSYTEKLNQYRKLYGTFGNLTVYTIKDLPLLCMKLVSFRPHSSDVDDCRSLISILRDKYSIEDVQGMIYNIYGDSSIMSVDAELFLTKEFECTSFLLDDESLDSYCQMINRNLISIESVPEEFRAQVESRLNDVNAKSIFDAINNLANI